MQRNLQADGGISLLLQAQPRATDQQMTQEQIENARAMLDERLKGTGATNSTVKVERPDRIRIEVPGTDALDMVRAVLTEHAQLEIVDGGSNPPMVDSHIVTNLGSPPSDKLGSQSSTVQTVWHTVFTDADIDSGGVKILPGPPNSPTILLTFTKDAAKKLADFTEANVGHYLPVVLDKKVISVPMIIDPMRGGQAAISTTDPVQALKLFVQLKYGPLPVGLKELEAKVIPPQH